MTRYAGAQPTAADATTDLQPQLVIQRDEMLRRAEGLPPAKRRTDVMTHEPYRQDRIHEMTKQAVLELIENEPEAAEPELEPEAALEGLENALER